MQTMHGVLQVGPYDWQPALLPVDEFHERLAALWTDLAGKGIDRVRSEEHTSELQSH